MKLLDANVFIYAGGSEHRLKEPCLRILELVEGGALQATTDIEVLQELLHFYRRKGRTDMGIDAIENALLICPDPSPVNVAITRAAARILTRSTRLDSRDAIHAALVLEYGLEGIISADRAFEDVVRRFDPEEFA